MSPRKKKVDELKDEIYKEAHFRSPRVERIEEVEKEAQVPKSEMDFTHIKGIGKKGNEEIKKKLEELGIDTKPKPEKPPVTIPSKELFRLVFNDLLAKKHKRKKLTMELDEQELKACGTATDLLLAKYPDANFLAKFVEINFAVTIGGIIIPRIILLIQQLIEKRKRGYMPKEVILEPPPPYHEEIVKEKKTKKK